MLNDRCDHFDQDYAERFERKHGFFRPVIREVVQDYLDCGDLKQGFARVRCPDCAHEYLLAFSCKARWFCPSCHTKKVIEFGDRLGQAILYPVPHRQYVFTVPIRLRVYFKYDRRLLSKLCRSAYQSMLIFLRTTMRLPDGVPGVVMAVQTFGEYPDRFHPHLHALVSDGLFTKSGTFYVMPKVDLKFLEKIFRVKVFAMLKAEGKIGDETIRKLLSWRHSGFNVHNGVRIKRADEEGRERLSRYILRNTFSVEKITYVEETGQVIYQFKMTHGKNRKNFEVYKADAFIAAITQHIPQKSFQVVRYYGWYSNKSRGMRLKLGIPRLGDPPPEESANVLEVIDMAEYQPKKIPSKTWRDCIKKIYEVGPLCCPQCGGELKIIRFITELPVIRQILKHIGLWVIAPRDPIKQEPMPELVCETFDDGWPGYEEPSFVM